MKQLVNQRGAIESFKAAEKRIQRVNADMEAIREKFEKMENELKRTDKLLFGFLREKHILPLMQIIPEYDSKWEALEPRFSTLQ
jgi:DNA repair exonuclease SbcCD ATPase subunit